MLYKFVTDQELSILTEVQIFVKDAAPLFSKRFWRQQFVTSFLSRVTCRDVKSIVHSTAEHEQSFLTV